MAKKTTKQSANNRLKGASPISGVVPPVEHRFKPGNPGKPKGASSKHTPEQVLRRILEKAVTEKTFNAIKAGTNNLSMGNSLTHLEALYIRLVYKGMIKGDVAAAREILDRAYGKAVQKTEEVGTQRIRVNFIKDSDEQ
jgi:hypothetical protein